MLTSSITTTIVYASPPNSTSLSSSGSGSSTPSNDKSKINSRSDSSGSSAGSGSSGGGRSTAHCDRPGYPACSNLGSASGKGALGTSCPTGHSKAFCKSYVAAAGSSASSPPGSPLQQGNTAHCDNIGYSSCYSLGYADGKNHPGTSCPGGHSQNYCNGYGAGTGSSTSNNNNNNNNNTTRSLSLHADAIHCNQVGWPSCYSVGYQAGVANLGTSCPSGHSADYCAGWNSGSTNIAHCDQPGWPSCYSLGYKAGKVAIGTTCPARHTQAFCNGYEYASGGSGSGYIQGVADPTHCAQLGFPACYDVGYHDGYNNAVNEHHQFHNLCPLGHSKAFCNGYVPGYNRGISYNLGFSQGVNNANQDWKSSNQNIHAFTYDCPNGHTKDFCNGYTDGYGDEANDILG
ncbi:MAG: hypothetical protein M3044_04005 [Thermoproteota archaeon]|nr:hypothetical protein [Thermoproteota archaeon]